MIAAPPSSHVYFSCDYSLCCSHSITTSICAEASHTVASPSRGTFMIMLIYRFLPHHIFPLCLRPLILKSSCIHFTNAMQIYIYIQIYMHFSLPGPPHSHLTSPSVTLELRGLGGKQLLHKPFLLKITTSTGKETTLSGAVRRSSCS